MESDNLLIQLIEKYQRGNRPAFLAGPFLPLLRIKERGLLFNDLFKDPQAMIEAARMSFEFGFESTILPFDLNMEAEILGAEVQYHDGFEGHPIYPTILDKPVKTVEDIVIPKSLTEHGRLPIILECIRTLKDQARPQGAVGAFVPGPFMLAGQVMDIDELYLMLLKNPESCREIFARLTTFIKKLIDAYIDAGIDFIAIAEGGGESISPKIFAKLVLPGMQDICQAREIPRIVFLFGSSKKIIECMLTCNPDGVILDKGCDIAQTREVLPATMPWFGECGNYDMLATATPTTVTEKVNHYLDMGFTSVGPPADIYPPAKSENIEAFVKALQEYKK